MTVALKISRLLAVIVVVAILTTKGTKRHKGIAALWTQRP